MRETKYQIQSNVGMFAKVGATGSRALTLPITFNSPANNYHIDSSSADGGTHIEWQPPCKLAHFRIDMLIYQGFLMYG